MRLSSWEAGWRYEKGFPFICSLIELAMAYRNENQSLKFECFLFGTEDRSCFVVQGVCGYLVAMLDEEMDAHVVDTFREHIYKHIYPLLGVHVILNHIDSHFHQMQCSLNFSVS